MAKPRVFISSTYYDLKQIRADLDRFVRELGYDPVLNEKGHIAYGSREELQEYCYKEINHCDILISIIGGRYGSSSGDEHSVSNKELMTAIKEGKQVYIFIDSTVATEFRTYEANKHIEGVNYQAVDDVRIYKFLEDVYKLPRNNTIHQFNSAQDITSFLKEQWAGLFHRLLGEESKKKEVDLIEKLSETSETLNQLVEFLVNEKQDSTTAITQILSNNHPFFGELQRKAEIPFRVYLENAQELIDLMDHLGFTPVPKDAFEYEARFANWTFPEKFYVIRVSKDLFPGAGEQVQPRDVKLKLMTNSEWQEDYIKVEDFIPF